MSAVAGVRILAIVFFFLGVSIFFYKNYVRRIEQVKWGAILSILSTSVFGLAFCIGSPQGIRGFNFLNGIVAVASVHKDGHWFRDETGLLGWLAIIVEPHVISLLWAGIAVVGLLFVLYRLITSERKLENGITLLPLAWLVVFCVVIVFRVKSHFAHYLIPILPFCFFYTAIGLNFLLLGLGRYVIGLPLGFGIDGIMILTFLAIIFSRFRERVDWSPANKHITILAAIWLGYFIIQLANPEARMIEPWIAGRGLGFYFFFFVVLPVFFF